MDLRPTTDPIPAFLYVAGGWICVGLAVVGAVLPFVPSAPFLLLASFCFYRGSPRLHDWLHRSRTFGPMLDDWEHYRGIRRGVKRRAVTMVVAMVAASLFYSSLPWLLRYVALGAVAVGLYVIWSVPTVPNDAPAAPRGDRSRRADGDDDDGNDDG